MKASISIKQNYTEHLFAADIKRKLKNFVQLFYSKMENLYSYIGHYCISSIKVPSQTSLDNSLPEPLSSPPNYAMFSLYRGGLLPAPWSLKFTILDGCSFILFSLFLQFY